MDLITIKSRRGIRSVMAYLARKAFAFESSDTISTRARKGVESRLESMERCTLYRGDARFLSPREVHVGTLRRVIEKGETQGFMMAIADAETHHIAAVGAYPPLPP